MRVPPRHSIELRDIESTLAVLRRLPEITTEVIEIFDDGVLIATLHPAQPARDDPIRKHRYRPLRTRSGDPEQGSPPLDFEGRVEALIRAPAGCVFLLTTEANGLSPAEAAEPVNAIRLASAAVDEVTIWRGDHEAIVRDALNQGERLRELARAVLAEPAAGWWFAPLDREAQLWVSPLERADTPPHPVVPDRVPLGWEHYAQKPIWGLFTSTEVDGSCSQLVAGGDLGSDLRPPLACYRMTVNGSARVFEVDGPDAWHELCARYPNPGHAEPLVPDFAAMAEDWDGVHLTLGGLLTAEQVRITGPSGWSGLWGWEAEQTVWLRSVFDEAVRLPDITTREEPRWFPPMRLP